VAVKVIRRGRVSHEFRGRFRQEQRVLARLHQTHVVPIHAAGEDGDLQYFAMPYIEGAALHHVVRAVYQRETVPGRGKTTSLSQVVDSLVYDRPTVPAPGHADAATPEPTEGRTLRLPPEYFRSVAEVLAQAAEALDHVHKAGVRHRDVKPSNLMVDTVGRCWVIDFGLAVDVTRPQAPVLTADGAEGDGRLTRGTVGTPAYMAPEQFQGRADERSDVWGLGATLYELLTLRPAFEGSTAELAAIVPAKDPVAPRRRVANVPLDLQAVCLKAIQKAPEHRYASARAMADDLRRWLRFEPTQARPARVPRRVAMWARRNKGWAFALVVAVAGLVATAGLAANRARLAEEAARLAEDAAREQEFQLHVQRAQHARFMPHVAGWSDDVWERVRAAAKLRPDETARDEAAASLTGIDARLFKRFAQFPATTLAFDSTGNRLLMGGWSRRVKAGLEEYPAHLWDRTADQVVASAKPGDGPVAFRADGTPRQQL
jgi:tRNA A-37 threonylcarbamoyl transferase component Bud32